MLHVRFHGDLQKRQTDKAVASFHTDLAQAGILAVLQPAWLGSHE
jgi:hypothetical protein